MKVKIMPKRIVSQKLAHLKYVCFALVCITLGSILSAQAEAQIVRDESNRNYRIGVGDVLKVVITRQESLSRAGLRVSNEGTIRLPELANEVVAVCLTEDELAEVITAKYKKFLINPETYVAVEEFHSNPVAMIGAVNSPGRFNIQRPTRLLELLTFVNGPTENAGKDIQIIRQPGSIKCGDDKTVQRSDPGNEVILTIPLADTLQGTESANPYLEAGDIISIAVADAPKMAYIIGNVVKPSPIELIEPITLTKALAIAGGTLKDAKIKKIVIHRQDPETQVKTVIAVNLKEVQNGTEVDVLLQPNDIVDVPGKKPSIFSKIFETLITTTTRGIVRF